MTTRRTLTWIIPGSPEEILRRMGDPDVAARRAAADPALEARVTELATNTSDGSALVMALTGQVPSGWVPDRVASALPAQPRIVRREAWRLADDGDAAAEVTVRLEAIPATSMTVEAALAALPGSATDAGAGPASTLTYDLRLDVGIPFVGAVIERAVMEQIARAYDAEAAVIRDG